MNVLMPMWSILILAVLFAIPAACAPSRQAPVSQPADTRCVRGTVWYKSPSDGSQVHYPKVKVAVWRLDVKKPLIEGHTDQNGNYCIEVPDGGHTIAIRVWGTLAVSGKTFHCAGSQEGIDLKTSGKTCGGECTQVDIVTECKEFVPSQHRRY
jgi:hypothetical protein